MKILIGNKNFLSLLLGRIITNIGDSLYYVASMWLVYELGESAFYTGLAGFLILLPKAMQFLTGPLVDRWNIRKVLVTTQILQSILILIIPITYTLNLLSIQLILIVMPIIALIEEFAYPTQTKALPLILNKSELVKANSVFSFAYQGIDLVFNALAGIFVASIGAISLYVVDSITFAIAACLFSFIKIQKNNDNIKRNKLNITSYYEELKIGISTVINSLLWVFLLGSAIVNFSIGITMAILPSLADAVGGVGLYGLLLASLSSGLLIGALIGPFLGRYRVGLMTILCFLAGSCSWIVASLYSSPVLIVLLFGIAWIPIGAINVLFAGITQSIIPTGILGRVTSVMYSFSIIFMPLGSLLGGYLATVASSISIFSFTGVGISLMAIVWLIHPDLRKLPKVNEMSSFTFKLSFAEKGNSSNM